MKELIINGQNVAEGRVVKALEAMLNGDEVVQRQYHPLCIIDETRDDEYQDVCRDIANGLIRLRLLNANEYIGFKEV